MEKTPLIYLFKTIHSPYCYDTNRNEILPISPELYGYLRQILRRAEAPELSAEGRNELEALREQGYLSDNRVAEVRHPNSPWIQTKVDRHIQQLLLQVTQNCNLRCSYCYYTVASKRQRGHSGKRMSWETAKAAIDYFWAHSVDTGSVILSFYGGEPLLEPELIGRCMDYASNLFEGKPIRFTMTTNATMLTRPILELLKQYHVQLMISLDGPRAINDKNRKFQADQGRSVYDAVMENLSLIASEYAEELPGVSINMVLDPSTNYSETQRFFRENQTLLSHFSISTSLVDDDLSELEHPYSEDFVRNYNYEVFLGLLANLHRVDPERLNPVARGFAASNSELTRLMQPIRRLPHTMSPGGPCIAGEHRLFVSCDGDFFPCEKVSELSKPMRIGSLREGPDLDHILGLVNVAELTAGECRECWAFRLCSSCARFADELESLSGEKRLRGCSAQKGRAASNLRSYILRQEVREYYGG